MSEVCGICSTRGITNTLLYTPEGAGYARVLRRQSLFSLVVYTMYTQSMPDMGLRTCIFFPYFYICLLIIILINIYKCLFYLIKHYIFITNLGLWEYHNFITIWGFGEMITKPISDLHHYTLYFLKSISLMKTVINSKLYLWINLWITCV